MAFFLIKAIPCFGYFGEMNLKAGLDINGLYHFPKIYFKTTKFDNSLEENPILESKTEFCLGAEIFPFFLPFNKEDNKPKFGIGLQYKISRQMIFGEMLSYFFGNERPNISFAFIPVYLTCQIKPFANSQDKAKGIFVKGDIGYSFVQKNLDSFNVSETLVNFDNPQGGLYYSLGIGYELPSGLFFSLMFSVYNFQQSCSDDNMSIYKFDIDYKDIGINIGYKFKI